ncbi:MAG TPA: anti-sigma regulatory factor [Bacteroidota bacterium]|nr:anti-sigma regulatory factor [Bacteroidota bacterium]
MEDGTVVPIRSDRDIIVARHEGRRMAADLGFAGSELTLIATAISELARNIVKFAHRGEISIRAVQNGTRSGISIIAKDEGPGIPDLSAAMKDGFSTSKGLGLGLPGTRRIMDDFEIDSQPGAGTTVIVKKWLPPT